MKHYELTIEGMGCAHCVKSVTEALAALGATVNRCVVGAADINFDGTVEQLKDAIAERGFDVTSVKAE